MIRWLRFMAKMLLLHGNLLMTFQTQVKAQIIYADNILIHVADGGLLHANGGIRLANQALLQNEGSVTTTKNSTLPSAGNFEISSSTQAEGNGLYRIEQDWVNDGQFIAGSSTVELYGDTEQFIRSTTGTITTFNHLILLGNGTGINRRKTLQGADAATGPNGNLVLNDREFGHRAPHFHGDEHKSRSGVQLYPPRAGRLCLQSNKRILFTLYKLSLRICVSSGFIFRSHPLPPGHYQTYSAC